MCNDNELYEWVVNVSGKFTLSSDLENGKYGYAYFISVEPKRDDIIIKVIDGDNYAYGEKYGSLYGVGCYTNLKEKTYKIEIYGAEDSKCKKELLKTIEYTVPMYNKLIKEDVCVKNPDSELCETFTNKTKDMTREELVKELEKENKTSPKSILKFLSYILYVLICHTGLMN